MKLKWKISEPFTGLMRIGNKRAFPTAEYLTGHHCCQLISESAYIPANIKEGNHSEIKIVIADYSENPWKNRTLEQRAKTVKEAKKIVMDWLANHPEYLPKGLEDGKQH